MFYVDWTLRISSLIVVALVFYQIFSKEKGDLAHRIRGYWAMASGTIIFICVAIRGAQNEIFTTTYALHLFVGTLFFISLFLTIRLGYLVHKVNEKYMLLHKVFAWITLIVLLGTLVLGIASIASH